MLRIFALPKKIHHLIRYFLLLGLLSLATYIFPFPFPQVSFFLIGPSIYFSAWVYHLAAQKIPLHWLPPPVVWLILLTLFYYGLWGFLVKELWNEEGKIRTFSLTAIFIFLLYLHYLAGKELLRYFVPFF